jgi:hypothetical protein
LRPLQVWIPTLNSDLAMPEVERDASRAFEAWHGETTVWLLPGLEKQVRWKEGPGRWVTAIPAEYLERIDVYHVGDNGHVVGLSAEQRFPEGRIDGLLDAWLNLESVGFAPAPERVPLYVPQVDDGKVTYRILELSIQPRGFVPITDITPEGKFSGRWPPEGTTFPTISPDAESEERYGPFERGEANGLPIGISQQDKHQGLVLHLDLAATPEDADVRRRWV